MAHFHWTISLSPSHVSFSHIYDDHVEVFVNIVGKSRKSEGQLPYSGSNIPNQDFEIDFVRFQHILDRI